MTFKEIITAAIVGFIVGILLIIFFNKIDRSRYKRYGGNNSQNSYVYPGYKAAPIALLGKGPEERDE